MPINTTHPEYQRLSPRWQKVLDCYEGEEAIKNAGETYLPKLQDQNDKDYRAYKARASFFPAVQRTVDGLVGGVFRVDPNVTGPDQTWLDDFTLTGMSFIQFAKYVTTRVLLTAKGGVLVDWDADAKRPFATFYDAVDITNWGEDFIVLRETEEQVDPDDRFKVKLTTCYRELRIVEGLLEVSLWRKEKNGWIEEKQETPKRAGEPMSIIPFVGIQPTGDTGQFQNPPLLGMANVNIAAYRNSSDLENGRHLCGFPTPWIADDDVKREVKSKPGTVLRLGSGGAFILGTGGQAGFMEFQGQGLQSLKEGRDEKMEEMGSLGAQIVLAQRTQVETAETARIHAAGQTSVLANVATGVEKGLKRAIDLFGVWANRTFSSTVELNREFVETTMDPQQLTALFALWNGGAISHETLLWNIKRGQLLPPDQSVADEKDAVDLESEALRKQAFKNAQDMAKAGPGTMALPNQGNRGVNGGLTGGKQSDNLPQDQSKGR